MNLLDVWNVVTSLYPEWKQEDGNRDFILFILFVLMGESCVERKFKVKLI